MGAFEVSEDVVHLFFIFKLVRERLGIDLMVDVLNKVLPVILGGHVDEEYVL